MTPTREIYWNVEGGGWIYLLAALAGVAFALGLLRHARRWRLGGPAARLDRVWERLRGVAAEALAQRRLRGVRVPGGAHLVLSASFVALFVASLLISVQEWSGWRFLQGPFYLGYSLASDLAGLAGLAAMGVFAWRRAVARPTHLRTARGDWLALGFLFLLYVQGFGLEGARIAVTELGQPLAHWSPGGWLAAHALAGIAPGTLRALHRAGWWLHAGSAFAFLGWIAYSKLDHLVYAPANVFLRNLGSSGTLAHPDIEATLEADPDALATLGVGRVDGFSWKDLLDLDACTQCGRCEAVCPASLSGGVLSPRKLILDLETHRDAVGPALAAARAAGDGAALAALPPLVGDGAPGTAPPAVLDAELWGCRTCGACQHACPVHIEHVPKIVDMRRHLVMTESRLGEEAQQMLRSLEDRGHPWRGSSLDREAWLQDLDPKLLRRGERAEWLLWVGCTGALVDRNVQVTRALVRVLQAAGVDFAVLGSEERCTGDPARRVGDELTFQACARANVETLAGYGVERVITSCAHCFHSFRNEYTAFGARFEVRHHSELLAELIAAGRLPLARRAGRVTFHDPCYLGRHNGVFDAPRAVLGAVAADGAPAELPRSRGESLCCGAGGGHAWLADPAPRRPSHLRFAEVQASGADTVAVGCPFCLQMLEDARNALDPERRVRTADLAELVAEALVD
jgi:Fe-S oxidoreductase/nitrate reductase gamma subunit